MATARLPGRAATLAVALAAGLLLTAGCSARSCPLYRVASNVTVDGTAFVAAHPQARTLCVARHGCVPVGRPARRPAVLYIPVSSPGTLHVTVTVAAGAGQTLLSGSTVVTVQHAVFNAACGITADLGAVTITRDGTLRSR